MAIVYGLTDQGFVTKSLTVIREDLNKAFRDAFGQSLSLNDRSVFGIIVGILSERFSILWELLEKITTALDPDKASGVLLDGLASLTGTFRPAPSPSTVTLTLTGVDTTVVATGSRAKTFSTGKEFETIADATITAVPAWATSTAYVLGDRVTNAGNVYQVIQAGTSNSSSSTAPTDTFPDLTLDGSVLWTFLGVGVAAVDVKAQSVDNGPVIGTSKDISQIATFIGGWQGVTNIESAALGRLLATDSELRTLRDAELGASGSSPFDSLRAALLKVTGVTSVTLFPNNTDLTDADGVPPHSVESLVEGGDDQDIFDTLLASVAVGIGTHGNTSGISVDSQGTDQTEKFSRAVEVPIYVVLAVSFDAREYPSDGDTQIKDQLAAYGASQKTGRDAVASVTAAQALKIDGVIDVPEVLLYTDVIGTPVAWAATTGYVATVGSRSVVSNDGGRKYICITSGTSAGSGGPTGTGTDITDGTVHWRFLGNPITITSRQRATFSAGVDGGSNPFIVVNSSAGTP